MVAVEGGLTRGVFVAGGEDSAIMKWCTASGRQLRRMDGHDDIVWALVLAPGDEVLYSGSADCTVRAWDTETGETLHVINPQRYVLPRQRQVLCTFAPSACQ